MTGARAEREIVRAILRELPAVRSASWTPPTVLVNDYGTMLVFERMPDRMRACVSVDEFDGGRWMHVSVSHRDHLPTLDDLKEAKETFIGDRLAVQVLTSDNAAGIPRRND